MAKSVVCLLRDGRSRVGTLVSPLVRRTFGAFCLGPLTGLATGRKGLLPPISAEFLSVFVKRNEKRACTNMSSEHTACTGADKATSLACPEDVCSTMNAEWRTASVNDALQNVLVVTDADAVVSVFS
ncbi:hypothetical protein GJW-30_1_04071 [Variibacter gotjawalensis]|uniref:Uncharacterized protein n=1 Tax=Variibacter gotjawalensis TaxID=1333996 RepID=A0A0S3PZY9_9BRAD|nr:hypothetical protein [Variibacter gotjawalensis]RZS49252.1 hypothetical protein EV661_1678 [Variibacter gotjawalensis]BAT61514.1 hypothetical protein GJW-30_1_04071 [Variibacter gotjawalensis]